MAKQAPTIQIPMGLKPYEADNLRALANGLKDIYELYNKLNSSTTVADGKVKIDSSDGVADFVEDKIKAGSGITLTKGNVGQRGGKTLTIARSAIALDGLSDVDAASPSDNDIIRYDSASGTWQHEAFPAGGGAMPLGYNFGVYVSYKDADEIYVEPGNIDVNGTDISVTTRTAHTMTSMVNATPDFHYIYLSSTGIITDSATEPAWSDAKFGWYNSTTRCIGAVWVPSATPAILSKFSCNTNHEYLYDVVIKEMVTNGNPDGTWQDITTASDYSPINADAARIYIYNTSSASYMYVYVSAYESKSYYDGVGGSGIYFLGLMGWVPLQASRDLSWRGRDTDNNLFLVRTTGYKLRI